MKLKVGLIGWRGMVGSVLMQRMLEEKDWARITPMFFSTSSSSIGATAPIDSRLATHVVDAYDIESLLGLDCIISMQGSEYTLAMLPKLRENGYNGYWLDTSSALRMNHDALIVLDPINRTQIDVALKSGVKNYVGGNCAITLVLLGLAGLFGLAGDGYSCRSNLVRWLSIMTYQAASGAGALQVQELASQMGYIANRNNFLLQGNTPILEVMDKIHSACQQADFPKEQFSIPLACNLIPWIDSDLGNGMSKEEWKSEVELNKILGLEPSCIRVDGMCVRVPTIRSHLAAVTVKLSEDLPLEAVANKIKQAHQWVDFVPNNKTDSLLRLTPLATSGALQVGVGRLRKSPVEDSLYTLITVADQLLWGAAEPIRRMLNILVDYV